MGKKRICFIAQFPPPIHGLSKAVETLYNSNLQDDFNFEKVDITNNKKFFQNLKLINKSKADLFYFTISQTKGGNIRDLIILNLLRMRKKKCLIHLHGGYYRKLVDEGMSIWQKKMNYYAISKVAGVIVLSKSLQSIFSGMIDEEKIYVVPNCIDDEYLINDKEFELKIKMVDEQSIKQVLYLSNFIKSKGYPKVLEMARLEKENHLLTGKRNFHFNFAGKFFEEIEETFFFRYIKENNLEEYITYYGIVTGQKKQQLLKDSHIFMLPTRYPNEGQPISILEAMGNGMFIISTNHAGIPDIIKDEINGIVMSDDNINSVFSSIQNLSFSKVANVNRKEALIKYTQKAYLEKLKEYFELI